MLSWWAILYTAAKHVITLTYTDAKKHKHQSTLMCQGLTWWTMYTNPDQSEQI